MRLIDKGGIERDALGLADREGLFHQRAEEAAQLGIVARSGRSASAARGRAGHGGEEDEFLPELALDVGGDVDVELGRLAGIDEGVQRGVGALVGAAEAHRREIAGVLDDARRGDHGRDVGGAADGRIGAQDGDMRSTLSTPF